MIDLSFNHRTINEEEIRKNLIKAYLVGCVIELLGQLFFNTKIPTCIWIFSKNKSGKDKKINKKIN